jgi:hypothetical protein
MYDTNQGMERIVKTKFMVVIKHVCKVTGVKFVAIEKLKVRHQDRVDYGVGDVDRKSSGNEDSPKILVDREQKV